MKPALFTLLTGLAVAAFALPVAAQQTLLPVPAPAALPKPAATAPADEGLSGSVTDESEWQELGIAIPVFPTDEMLPTAADGGNTEALGRNLARVVYGDLKNNGLFKPVGPDALPGIAYGEVSAPVFGGWRARSAEMLVQGFVKAGADGRLTVGCYLYDVALGSELAAIVIKEQESSVTARTYEVGEKLLPPELRVTEASLGVKPN